MVANKYGYNLQMPAGGGKKMDIQGTIIKQLVDGLKKTKLPKEIEEMSLKDLQEMVKKGETTPIGLLVRSVMRK